MRSGTDADWPAVVDLIRESMGWPPDAPLAEYLAWKHLDNYFGPSHVWVAAAGDRVVGARILLRWEFESPEQPLLRAVRAVDTATADSHRGQGIFTALTLTGIRACQDSGCQFVYNTPNQQSRPGYLKMGWRTVGRLPVSVRAAGLSSWPQMARSGVPADRFSVPTDIGEDAGEVLADGNAIEELLASTGGPRGLRTRRTVGYLRWRYGSFPLLHYRSVVAGEARRGLAIFRLRKRGHVVETAIVDILAPDRRTRRSLLAEVGRAGSGGHAITLARGAVPLAAGFLPLPGRGPILTARALAGEPPTRTGAWNLSLGDVELF